MVDVTGYLFTSNFQLRTDAASSWAQFVTDLGTDASYVVAFYLVDEPNINGVSADSIQAAASIIRGSSISRPIATIYAQANSNFVGVDAVDWVGIDCYNDGGFHCQKDSYSNRYGQLRSQLRSDQRTILVPQAGLPVSSNDCCVAQLQADADKFYLVAYGDQKVIGIFPFIWESFNTNANWKGLTTYSSLQPTFRNIGQEILSNWAYPSNVTPVWRFYDTNDHFYTLSVPDGVGALLGFEGVSFNVYTTQIANTVHVYRCYVTSNFKRLVSTDLSCEGQALEWIFGYIYPFSVGGSIPLYRFYASTGENITTTNYSEGTNAGMTFVGILG